MDVILHFLFGIQIVIKIVQFLRGLQNKKTIIFFVHLGLFSYYCTVRIYTYWRDCFGFVTLGIWHDNI